MDLYRLSVILYDGRRYRCLATGWAGDQSPCSCLAAGGGGGSKVANCVPGHAPTSRNGDNTSSGTWVVRVSPDGAGALDEILRVGGRDGHGRCTTKNDIYVAFLHTSALTVSSLHIDNRLILMVTQPDDARFFRSRSGPARNQKPRKLLCLPRSMEHLRSTPLTTSKDEATHASLFAECE